MDRELRGKSMSNRLSQKIAKITVNAAILISIMFYFQKPKRQFQLLKAIHHTVPYAHTNYRTFFLGKKIVNNIDKH